MLVSLPMLTLAFAVLLGRERATLTGVFGIVVGLSGALLLIIPRGGVDLSAGATVGNLFLLAGAASYAMYLVLTRGILRRHEPLRVISWVFLFSALSVLPFGIGNVSAVLQTGISTAGWLSIAYAVIGGTVIPYLINNWALVRTKSSLVGMYVLFQPVFAGSLGRLILDEKIVPNTALAAALVITGVLLSSWKRSGA
jgi:drug/metabolite transporter (DMT)-like permease